VFLPLLAFGTFSLRAEFYMGAVRMEGFRKRKKRKKEKKKKKQMASHFINFLKVILVRRLMRCPMARRNLLSSKCQPVSNCKGSE